MMFEDALTDEAKLLDVLLREQVPHPAWWVAEHAGVDPEYAEAALRRVTTANTEYPVIRRSDLGSDVYEATEDSARDW